MKVLRMLIKLFLYCVAAGTVLGFVLEWFKDRRRRKS